MVSHISAVLVVRSPAETISFGTRKYMLASDCVRRCPDVGVRVAYATKPSEMVNISELSDLCVVKRYIRSKMEIYLIYYSSD